MAAGNKRYRPVVKMLGSLMVAGNLCVLLVCSAGYAGYIQWPDSAQMRKLGKNNNSTTK